MNHHVTLNQLRAFVASAREGSFTAAAESLGVAQASVSELVRRLEDELGAALFARGSRLLSLTAAGQELLAHAQETVAGADRAVGAVRNVGALGGGTATFGVLRNADFYLLSSLVRTFHERYPTVRIRLVGQNSAETAAAVAAGTIEAGLVILPVDAEGLSVTPLLRDEVLYVSADPARTAHPVSIEAFAQAPLVLYDAHYGSSDPTRRQLVERAQLAGLRIEPIIEVEHVQSALRLVADGIGDTLASRAVISSDAFPAGLHVVAFAEPLYDTIAFVRARGRALSPATRELVRLAQDMIGELRDSDGYIGVD